MRHLIGAETQVHSCIKIPNRSFSFVLLLRSLSFVVFGVNAESKVENSCQLHCIMLNEIDLPKRLVAAIWLIINIIIYATNHWTCSTKDDLFYLRFLAEEGICTARGSAIVILFNSFLALLLMCRNLISQLKGSKFTSRTIGRLLDNTTGLHKLVGYALFIGSSVHTAAHIAALTKITRKWKNNNGSVVGYVNRAMFSIHGLDVSDGSSLMGRMQILTTVPVITGILILKFINILEDLEGVL